MRALLFSLVSEKTTLFQWKKITIEFQGVFFQKSKAHFIRHEYDVLLSQKRRFNAGLLFRSKVGSFGYKIEMNTIVVSSTERPLSMMKRLKYYSKKNTTKRPLFRAENILDLLQDKR